MAKTLNMPESEKAFYRGVLIGLQLMHSHDTEVMFHEFVREVGAKPLVKVAQEEDALEWSGLARYGYVTKAGRLNARNARGGFNILPT